VELLASMRYAHNTTPCAVAQVVYGGIQSTNYPCIGDRNWTRLPAGDRHGVVRGRFSRRIVPNGRAGPFGYKGGHH